MSFVAQNINAEKFDVTLIIIGFEKDCQYNVQGINLVFLNKKRVLKAIPKLLIFLKKYKQDVVVSAIGHLNTIMALTSIFFINTKFIAREVNVNSVLKKHSDSKSLAGFHSLSIYSKKLLDKVICQSKDMAEDIMTNYKVKADKIVVINNPISNKFIPKKRGNLEPSGVIKFITVGRLAKQKGHVRILEALKKINFPFHYTLIGDGPEKNIIFAAIEKYNLSSFVSHIPYTNEVERYLADNDIFLQGSFVEGFPNALIESCAVGTPVIAFKAPGGIDEIIIDGVNGYIAQSAEDFISKIELLSQTLQDLNPNEVSQSVMSRYSSEKIISEYEDLFLSVLDSNI